MEKVQYTYWQNKVNSIIKISKEYGYSSYDAEFWKTQPSGVISLIIDIYSKKTTKEV